MARNKYGLIDSSVVMALFNGEDRQYKKAVEVFKTIKKKKIQVRICCVTIIELVSLMKYKKINQWQKYCNKLIDGKMFYIDNVYFFDVNDMSWKLTLKEENIGMVDAIEIEHCLQNREELITFDKKQEEVYKKLLRKSSN